MVQQLQLSSAEVEESSRQRPLQSFSQHTIVFCGLLSVLNYRICHPLGTLLVAQEAVEQQRTEHIVGSKRSQVLRVKVEVTER